MLVQVKSGLNCQSYPSSHHPGTPKKKFDSLADRECNKATLDNVLPYKLQNWTHSRISNNPFLDGCPVLTESSLASDLVVSSLSGRNSVISILSCFYPQDKIDKNKW